MSTIKTKLKTKVTAIANPGDAFPEQALDRVKSLTGPAICISGGGIRAYACAVGALRALDKMGVTQKSPYLSTSSSASWAAAVYTYSKFKTEELLGTDVEPSKLDMAYLAEDNGFLGEVVEGEAFDLFGKAAGLLLECKGKCASMVWEKAVGTKLLQPFGINGKLFAWDEENLRTILDRNPTLKAEDFITAQDDKPFLILHSTLQGPQKAEPTLSSLQITPLYTGCPYYQNQDRISYPTIGSRKAKSRTLLVGGGVIETFAFGSKEPTDAAAQRGGDTVCEAPEKEGLFTLDRALALSSSDFSARFKQQNISLFKSSQTVEHTEMYWPILSSHFKDPQKACLFTCGDGTDLDNTGILPALQRGAKSIVAFINSDVTIFYDENFKVGENVEPVRAEEVDDILTSLFGVSKASEKWDYSNNQVFPEEDLGVVIKKMAESYNAGNGAVARHTIPLLENRFWNIKGGYDVDILFIYNSDALNFRNQLPDDTLKNLEKGEDGRLFNYPYFDTMYNNNSENISLHMEQINLLAATTSFVVKQQAQTIKDMETVI